MKHGKILLATAALTLTGTGVASAQIASSPASTTITPNTASTATVATPAAPQSAASPTTPAAPGATDAAAASTAPPQPSCPAGTTNPAAVQAAIPNLPASLQKLYALRLPQFTAADLNCDGFLDQGEQKQLIDQKFIAADTDKNGTISEAEAQAIISNFDEAAQNTAGIIAEKREATLKHRLALIDSNNDDVITKQEFETFYLARFAKLDRNGDGKLDITEYQTDDEDNRRRRD